jgi:UDP-N-acetyl-D-glucosamine/UDP-N-acetyl-D-galactosamine dehydrogenase
MLNNKIAVIGLGYLGLPLALAFGQKFNAIGFGIDKNRINELNNKKDLNLLSSKKNFYKAKKIKFTSNEKKLKNVNTFIVIVPTSVKKNNEPGFSYLCSASK